MIQQHLDFSQTQKASASSRIGVVLSAHARIARRAPIKNVCNKEMKRDVGMINQQKRGEQGRV